MKRTLSHRSRTWNGADSGYPPHEKDGGVPSYDGFQKAEVSRSLLARLAQHKPGAGGRWSLGAKPAAVDHPGRHQPAIGDTPGKPAHQLVRPQVAGEVERPADPQP